MVQLPEQATVPTMYFIGVTTTKSSIMMLFPKWAKILGFPNAVLKGIDLEIHADPSDYRKVVEFIKNDEHSLGALVTTHKIDLYEATKDLFDEMDPFAKMFGELSCISKKEGMLCGHAKDPISSGMALERFIPGNYWSNNEGEALILGAGGSAIAISSYLVNREKDEEIPKRLVITDMNEKRLEEIKHILSDVNPDVNVEYHLISSAEENDVLLQSLADNSLIINATGLGKDRPGSPLSDSAQFPSSSFVWELNYRGDRHFMYQALAQKERCQLQVEDGWIYFLHGWTQVISEVFHLPIEGETFQQIEGISSQS